MLCVIELMSSNIVNSTRVRHIIDVPDELFMLHTAVYGEFKPAMLTDRELQDCTWIGQRGLFMKYIGPAEEQETK